MTHEVGVPPIQTVGRMSSFVLPRRTASKYFLFWPSASDIREGTDRVFFGESSYRIDDSRPEELVSTQEVL